MPFHRLAALPAWGAGTAAVADGDLQAAIGGLFEAIITAVPYVPSTVFLAAERAKPGTREGSRRRVALIVDGIGSMHGVTQTIEQIRERGVPGVDVDVIGIDAGVDRSWERAMGQLAAGYRRAPEVQPAATRQPFARAA